ncbi:SSrecog-domain-containing protein [Cylindrobasidium torrendii FP15055 ss-10]|uniref:FACT complex subunit POB3 n=1 Tax=Cylindrobasidium torrendii FP15055 ss-10 TaxID=1314674 RepID=A0A0D7B6F9_9AGAR|nr:SSrecog-domain-containing protein [Cylindrobasidium torrendii FP15055 ss-10]
MTTQFDRIYHGLSRDAGKFRVAASGMAWKGADADTVVAMGSKDIKWSQWMRVGRGYQLRVGLANHRRETFDGFAREDHERMSKMLEQFFNITLESKEVSVKGWNWGVTDVQGQELAYNVGDKLAFLLPLQHVSNSNIAGRTEVSLEFALAQGKKMAGDEMTEIRFHVPGTSSKAKGSDAGSQKSDDEAEEEQSAAQVFHDMIKEKADIGQVVGDTILSFEEVLVVTPRGRYDVDMYNDFLRLRGKTYDYKILYTSIEKLFLLPKDDMHVMFILGLSTPVRQGQTRYSYLVMQFTKEEEITAELNLTDEELSTYDKLNKNYEAPTYEVVSSVFRGLTRNKIIHAGTSFESRDKRPSIKAHLKATQGDLFMLEKYIFFVSKQPLLIALDNLHQVYFSRVGASMGANAARTFDLRLVQQNGPEYTFTSIQKEEKDAVENYLKDKKIKIKNEMVPDAQLITQADLDDDDDDDMDSRSENSDTPAKKKINFDDDDSETDESFQASSTDAGSPTESDDSDGGAATASDASGDAEFKKKKSKKSKGKEKANDGETPAKKKKKSKETVDSDAEDDNPKKSGSPRPKPKKAKKKDSGDDKMDIDGEDKTKKKSKPKAKAAEDKMDVDEPAASASARPKPKPVKKVKETDPDEPPKKRQKKADD